MASNAVIGVSFVLSMMLLFGLANAGDFEEITSGDPGMCPLSIRSFLPVEENTLAKFLVSGSSTVSGGDVCQQYCSNPGGLSASLCSTGTCISTCNAACVSYKKAHNCPGSNWVANCQSGCTTKAGCKAGC